MRARRLCSLPGDKARRVCLPSTDADADTEIRAHFINAAHHQKQSSAALSTHTQHTALTAAARNTIIYVHEIRSNRASLAGPDNNYILHSSVRQAPWRSGRTSRRASDTPTLSARRRRPYHHRINARAPEQRGHAQTYAMIAYAGYVDTNVSKVSCACEYVLCVAERGSSSNARLQFNYTFPVRAPDAAAAAAAAAGRFERGHIAWRPSVRARRARRKFTLAVVSGWLP